MFEKNSVIRKKCCNAHVCILNTHVNKTTVCFQYYFKRAYYRTVKQKIIEKC